MGKVSKNLEKRVKFTDGNKAAEKWSEDEALRLGNNLIDWLREADENIFFEDFIYLQSHDFSGKVYPEVLAYLSNKFPSFLNLLGKAKKIEEIKIKKFSAFDKLNSTISKFLLSANHGYKERSDITTDDKKIDSVTVFELPSDGRNK